MRWGHWLMSHAAAWQRDDMRLADLMPRVATLPLGSGALAGNPFLVDRQFIAKELGMVGGVCPNSMDAVSDREWLVLSKGCGLEGGAHFVGAGVAEQDAAGREAGTGVSGGLCLCAVSTLQPGVQFKGHPCQPASMPLAASCGVRPHLA